MGDNNLLWNDLELFLNSKQKKGEFCSTEEINGLKGLYNDYRDPTLRKKHFTAEKLCYQYNQTFDLEERSKLLENLFHSVGKNVEVEVPFRCYYGSHISLGDNVYINHECLFLDDACISIGENTMLGPGVHIYTPTHPLNPFERIKPGSNLAKPVTIGKNVWICGRVIILSGVTIGDNTTIGAASVVKNDIPSNCLALGNPCVVVKNLNI